MEVLPIILFVAVAAALLYVSWWQREQRRKAFLAAAAQLGLTPVQGDPFGLLDLPFVLFAQGDGRGIDHAMHGRWDDLDVKAFEYWYYVRRSNGKYGTRREYHRFSCALLDVGLTAPAISISRETLATRIADKIGGRDIDFESEEFNRRMEVHANDRRFASYLIDARMMEWLLQAPAVSYEMHGRSLLCFDRRFAPERFGTLLQIASGFRARIPRVVHDTYGGVR